MAIALERASTINFDALAKQVGGEVVRTNGKENVLNEKLLVGNDMGVFKWGLIREIRKELLRVSYQDETGRADVTDLNVAVNGHQIIFQSPEV